LFRLEPSLARTVRRLMDATHLALAIIVHNDLSIVKALVSSRGRGISSQVRRSEFPDLVDDALEHAIVAN
jgi:hypothetical protein